MTNTSPTCPECAGAWVHDLKFNHGTRCPIAAADDRQRLVDLNTGRELHRNEFTRPALPHERQLLTALGWNPPPGELLVTDYGAGVDRAGNKFMSTWIRGVIRP